MNRVENLVDLYRQKIKESEAAKELQNAHDAEKKSLDEYGDFSEFVTTKMRNKVKANEQLIGHFYSKVAAGHVDAEIENAFLADYYDASIFSNDDEDFLACHFADMVNYIMLHPVNELAIADGLYKSAFHIPSDLLKLIGERVNITPNSKLFEPFHSFGQMLTYFPNCFCKYGKLPELQEDDEDFSETIKMVNAWQKVACFANGMNVEEWDVDDTSFDYDVITAFSKPSHEWERLQTVFHHLHENGKMILVCRPYFLWDSVDDALRKFRHQLVKETTIREIICYGSLTYVMILEKRQSTVLDSTLLINASIARKEGKDGYAIDFGLLHELMQTGVVPDTGLRMMNVVPQSELDADMLLPEAYIVEKPTTEEEAVPLATLCTLMPETSIKNLNGIVTSETRCITKDDLSVSYKGDINVNNLKTFEQVKDKFALDDASFTILDGSHDAILLTMSDGIKMGLVRACGQPILACLQTGWLFMRKLNYGMLALRPNEGVDAETIMALLRLPIVRRRLIAFTAIDWNDCGRLEQSLSHIMLPYAKRQVRDSIILLNREQKLNKKHAETLSNQKTEYVNEVRMRKHDMRPHLRQLASCERLMRHYLDEGSLEKLASQLDNLHEAVRQLNELLDHLSDEEKFGPAERVDLDAYCRELIKLPHDGFKMTYNCDHNAMASLGIRSVNTLINKHDLNRMVQNVIQNAKTHGFTDESRTDYEISVRLSVEEDFGDDRYRCRLKFVNNGNLLPNGLNKERYGLKGEKAGITGGTGCGGNIVKNISQHFGGGYDVYNSGDGDRRYVVVSIYLPLI